MMMMMPQCRESMKFALGSHLSCHVIFWARHGGSSSAFTLTKFLLLFHTQLPHLERIEASRIAVDGTFPSFEKKNTHSSRRLKRKSRKWAKAEGTRAYANKERKSALGQLFFWRTKTDTELKREPKRVLLWMYKSQKFNLLALNSGLILNNDEKRPINNRLISKAFMRDFWAIFGPIIDRFLIFLYFSETILAIRVYLEPFLIFFTFSKLPKNEPNCCKIAQCAIRRTIL